MNISIKQISYILNKSDFTAKVAISLKASGDIIIPHIITYKNQEYIVNGINPSSFRKNLKIKSIEISEDSEIKSISKEAFAQSSIKSISIPKSVNFIGEFAFFGCKNLTTVKLHEDSQLRVIERYAFTESHIETIKIPTKVEYIGDFTFSNCRNLRSIEFPADSNLKAICKNVFAQSSIEKVSIPSKVHSIFEYAFYQCKSLKTVDFSDDSELHSIGKDAFSLSSIEKITIPSKVNELSESWCGWTSNLNNISIMKGNENFCFVDNSFILGKSDIKVNFFDFLIFSVRDIKNVTIPPYIRRIGMYAFCSCEKVDFVDFGIDSKLDLIEKCAFSKSSIIRISIPSSVRQIDEMAFSGCWCLESIEFLSDEIVVGNNCFSYNQNLSIVSFPNAKRISFGKDQFYSVSINFKLFIHVGSVIVNFKCKI